MASVTFVVMLLCGVHTLINENSQQFYIYFTIKFYPAMYLQHKLGIRDKCRQMSDS